MKINTTESTRGLGPWSQGRLAFLQGLKLNHSVSKLPFEGGAVFIAIL